MEFFESHCHLADDKYALVLDEIINNAKRENVKKIITIGCSIIEAEKSLQIAKTYNEYVYSTAGLYPHDNESEQYQKLSTNERLKIIESMLITNPEIKAVGECGLDYKEAPPHEKARSKEEQIDLFQNQIQIAKHTKKPLIIHSRMATADTLKIIKETKFENFVWHCFSEDLETAKAVINANGKLSFTGLITYKKFAFLKEVIEFVPDTNLLIETDGPYLIPESLKKSKPTFSEPWHVRIIAQEIATIKRISLEQVADFTTKNAINFFGI